MQHTVNMTKILDFLGLNIWNNVNTQLNKVCSLVVLRYFNIEMLHIIPLTVGKKANRHFLLTKQKLSSYTTKF